MISFLFLKRFFTKRTAIIAGAVAVFLIGAGLLWRQQIAGLYDRATDSPPTILFTWFPDRPTTLKDFEGDLKITDDRGLDFTTYRFTVEEINKTVDLPIEGLIGREYEQKIYLGLIADKPIFQQKKQATIVISIADNRGQKTTVRRVVYLK